MAVDSQYIFDYLNDIWDLLSEQDRMRFGETWKAYEQTYGYAWMQQFEINMGNSIQYLPLYNIKRWLQHEFDDTTALNLAASFTSDQDFTLPIDLEDRYLVDVSIDGGPTIEVNVQGPTPGVTTLTEIVTAINTAFGKTIAFAIDQNKLLEIVSPTEGPTSTITFYPASNPSKDASAIIWGLDPIVQLPLTTPEFPYAFQLGEGDIVGLPSLQSTVHNPGEIPGLETIILTENVDYVVEFGNAVILFAEPPPAFMWAPDTLVNYQTPYNNFGYLMEYYDTNNANYLKAVQGLWYAYWNGPRPDNIRNALYLLFDLPTASKTGTVTSITNTNITLTYTDMTTETFPIPNGLSAIVLIGQSVTQFQPLVSGINVYDKVNYPGFLIKEVGRPGVQPFLTQFATRGVGPDTDETMALTLLENTTYLPQINVYAFTNPSINLANVQTFLRNIQPRSRTYLFQIVVGIVFDQLELLDEGLTGHITPQWPNGQPALGLGISFDATSNVDWNSNSMGDLAEWEDAENNPYTYLTIDDSFLNFGEYGQIDVFEGVTLIDSFMIEG